MKNLKKLMSVLLTVAMLMSFAVSASAASFADVDETNSAYEAIEVLAALKILEGKDANNFDPDANIKRSEFAAVICRALNAEAAASGSAGSKFSDVAADHWAAGYINWAADSGIVNGRGNGNFDPDANVTYQEAVKMIVAAMGFSPLAEKRGGYPTGYMAIANTYSITSGVAMSPATKAADRKGVAQLVYNAFDAPLMDASYITLSDDDEYKIYDGSKSADYERRTILSYYHDIYKFKATVDNTYRSDDSLRKSNGDKYIEMEITNLYKFDKDDIKNEFTVPSNFYGTDPSASDNTMKALITDTSYADYIGYTVNAYVINNEDGENEIVAMVADTNSVEMIEIDNPSTLISNASVSGQTVTFEYWETEDSSRTTTAKFVDWNDVIVYVNGVADFTFDENDFASMANNYNTVTLMGTKSEGKMSKVMLNSYIYGIIDEIDADEMIVSTTANDDFTFNMDDHLDEFSYTIYKDGAVADFADLAVGDMLNIITDSDGQADFADAVFADIYVTSAAVEGSVGSVSTDSKSKTVYTIDGVDYYLTSQAQVSSLKAGDTGMFYITIDGYIYDADLSKSTSGNYAFILDIAKDTTGFGSEWQLKLLTKDNNKVTYSVKSTVKVTLADGTYNSYKDSAQDTVFNPVETLVNDNAGLDAAKLNGRMITYKVSGDEISEITFAKLNGGDRDFNYRTLNGKYNAKTESLASYDMLSSTIIFNAPVETDGSLNEDKVQVYAVNSLDEDKTDPYVGFVFDIDNDGAAGAVLITNDLGFAGKTNALAIVKSVSTGLDANGDSADVINFYQAGEMKSLAITSDAYIGTLDVNTLTAGDVFQYTTNAAGEINNAQVVYDFDVKAGTGAVQKAKDGDIEYVTGLVTEAKAKRVDLATGVSFAWDLEDGYTNALFDVAKAKSNVNNAFKNYNTSTNYIKDATIDASGKITSDAYVVFAKVDDGSIVEVVTYKFAKVTGGIDATTFNANFTNK